MAGGKNKIHETGKGFQNNPQNIQRKGRPINRFKTIIEKYIEQGAEPMTKDDFIKFLGVTMAMTENEMIALESDPNAPFWMRLVCRDIASGESRQKVLVDMYDRMFGKAKETHEFKGEIKNSIDMYREIKVNVNGKVK